MGIFSGSSNHICPYHSLAEDAPEPFIGNTSFYHFNMILSGSCAAFSCLVIFLLMFMHATHLSKPNEQIKILQIARLIPFYSILSFISICAPISYVYVEPWLDLVQSVALGAFFLLMCEFVSPSPDERDLFFAAFTVPKKDRKGNKGPQHGLEWFRKRWIFIFQYPVVALACAIATDVTQAASVFCLWESKPYFAHLWISIAQTISVSLAVLSVLRFYVALKSHLPQHKPLAKLLAFKIVVFLGFIQSIIFWILRDVHALDPTSKLTYADLNIGIPTLIICIEMVPLSVFFHYAYSVQPYKISKSSGSSDGTYPSQGQSYQGGFLGIRALLVMWNPMDILKAIAFAFKMATVSRQQTADYQNGAPSYHPMKNQTMRSDRVSRNGRVSNDGRLTTDAQKLLNEAARR